MKKPKEFYKIEARAAGLEKWTGVIPFTYMQKSFASGAWAMLKSFYNHSCEYRLLKGSEVVDTCTKQTIKLN